MLPGDSDQRSILIGVGVAAVVIVIVICLFTYRHTDHATITGVAWQREIQVESWQTVRHDDWTLPADGRLISTHEEIHHWNRVYAGSHTERYSCGTSSNPKQCTRSVSDYRNEPVYRTKYVYDRDEWIYARSLVCSGNDKDVKWADATDLREPSGAIRLGDERLGRRIETYLIRVSANNRDSDQIEIPFSAWQTYAVGQHVRITRNILGYVDNIEADT